MFSTILIALLLPLLGTVTGSAFVFLVRRDMPDSIQKVLMGFASGVMVAASVWSLLIPAMDFNEGRPIAAVIIPPAVGFLAGMAFLLLIDRTTPHLHPGDGSAEGPRSRLSRTAMLTLAVTIHNLPEGMAVGVVLGGAAGGQAEISAAAAIAMAVGIAIQNIPEGAIISMPMRAEGNSRLRSFAIGCASGLVEPLGALAVLLLTSVLAPLTPYTLSFAAGTMLYVVVEELIPEAGRGSHSNIGTVGFALGFVMMMTLDVVLG